MELIKPISNLKSWCFDSPKLEENLFWVQRAVGIYLIVKFLFLIPQSTVVISSVGVNIPWLFDVPEPSPILALLIIMTMIGLGGILLSKTCNPAYLWVATMLYFYLDCLSLGSVDCAFEIIQLTIMIVLSIGRTLNEPTWSIRILQIFAWNIYFWCGIHKLTNGVWMNGYLIPCHLFAGWSGEINFQLTPYINGTQMYRFMEIGVVSTELLLPLLMILPTNKLRILIIAILLHGPISILMNLPEFLNMLILCTAFLTPNDRLTIRKILDKTGIWKMHSQPCVEKYDLQIPAKSA
jgi:hypothetical protein